jgi:uncharacterized membrane protein YsdA (DUF1294 family)
LHVGSVVFFHLPQYLILLYYLQISVFTFFIYAWDKQAAQKGRWRIPERILHLLALFGGWPGALLGQYWLPHKLQKQPFKALLWLTIAINSSVLLGLYTPFGLFILQQVMNLIPV